ncbi:unnamed protein product [Prorocentrum cordatum]|uniref:RRM domain-containing protein n=1 Tax=Prorocentrum cordatum TaxID=2364126 RepID=A0ABN9WD97_9DINO|nr:unnamed protein product [Polarella glacialis]
MQPLRYPWPVQTPEWWQLPPHHRHGQQDQAALEPDAAALPQSLLAEEASQSWAEAAAALQSMQSLHQAIMYDAVMRHACAPVPIVHDHRPQSRATAAVTEGEAMVAAERALALLELEEQQRPAELTTPPGLRLARRRRGASRAAAAPSRGGAAGCGEDDAARQDEVRMLLQRMEAMAATTVMVRNLPRQLAQEQLLQKFIEVGLAGTFDFLYMPINVATGEGNGYGFINFSSWPGLQRFVHDWHGRFLFPELHSDASLSVSIATQQGKTANVMKWGTPRLKRVRNPVLKPIVLPDPLCNIAEELERQQAELR